MKHYRPTEVYCAKCNKRFDTEDVEFLDISEDFQGFDLMKFRCPVCKTEQESHVTT